MTPQENYHTLKLPSSSSTDHIDFKFTCLEDFKFMRPDKNQPAFDSSSNLLFMKQLRTHKQDQSCIQKSQNQLIKDFKIQPPAKKNADGEPEVRKRGMNEHVFADSAPSFYERDFNRYLQKFDRSIVERQHNKLHLKKVFKTNF